MNLRPLPPESSEPGAVSPALSTSCTRLRPIGVNAVPAEKLADRRLLYGGEEMRVTFDQRDTRPAAFYLQRQQVAIKRVMPARPGVPEVVRSQFGIEPVDRREPRRVPCVAEPCRFARAPSVDAAPELQSQGDGGWGGGMGLAGVRLLYVLEPSRAGVSGTLLTMLLAPKRPVASPPTAGRCPRGSRFRWRLAERRDLARLP